MNDHDAGDAEDASPDTTGEWYTERLGHHSDRSWKRLIPDPYRWHLRRMGLGRVLDVGCGIGRCLAFLDGNGVGIDHNPTSVEFCRRRGLEAYTPSEFDQLSPGLFDSLLLSHVLEHTSPEESQHLLSQYLPFVRTGGKLVLITPQPSGQRSDPTHVRYLDRDALRQQLQILGATEIRTRSFPFPAVVGRVFRFNENVAIGHHRGAVGS